jgi:hypothetical protein
VARIADLWCPQLAHRLAPLAPISLDWDWWAKQIDLLRQQGVTHPGIMVMPNGDVMTADFSRYPAIPALPDPATHVLVGNNASGYEILLAVSWDELRAGKGITA